MKRLREVRPADFTVSMRVQWDGTDRGVLRVLRALVDAAIGVELPAGSVVGSKRG